MEKTSKIEVKIIANNLHSLNTPDQSTETSSSEDVIDDEITEQIINKKLSFINPEPEKSSKEIDKLYNEFHLNDNKENIDFNQKIENDIQDLLLELYFNRYNKYPQKVTLTYKSIQSKKQIQFFCNQLGVNFSVYILNILGKKIYSLIENIINLLKDKEINGEELTKIYDSLRLTGYDIQNVFSAAFNNTQNFDISNVLTEIFIACLSDQNTLSLEHKKIIENNMNQEKKKFETFLENISNKNFINYIEENINNNLDNDFNNIDDLVKYINTNEKKNKKKKKKKKNKNVQINHSCTECDDSYYDINDKEDNDFIVKVYKTSINNYTQLNIRTKKIKPNIPTQWINNLESKVF